MTNLRVLVIDDEKSYRDEIGEFLSKRDFSIYKAGLPSQAFNILKEEEIDIVILDINLPEMDGLEVLKKINNSYPEIEIIMITGHGDMDSVINAMRLGASDYFNKPFSLIDIQNSIERTKRYIDLNSRLKEVQFNNSLLSKELKRKTGSQIIGKSSVIRKVIEMISQVAKSDSTSVLITGESGTGKELVARGIHYLSSRHDKYFYDVNCSSVPENLFESEFFGHKKGAFTGAIESKVGWFEIANKGTLFLDEIGDLPLNLQVKFLRVLEQKSIRKVGSHENIPIDVKIIAATNRNIRKMVSENKFREDLYFRLNTFEIVIPPLRDRKEDIPMLIDHFVKHFSNILKKTINKIDNSVYLKLAEYHFPGNVRELKNMIEKAMILCEGDVLRMKYFPLESEKIHISKDVAEEIFDLEINEKNLILRVLKKCNYK
nr:sigma-54-dependent Fis family transcriptional regulator [Candidatus Cloacimonadota bacterium]